MKKTDYFSTRDSPIHTKLGNQGYFCSSDALDFFRQLKSEIADIVFLDPPFNLGKPYGDDAHALEHASETDYQTYLLKVVQESGRVLRDGGALFLYHLPVWASKLIGPMMSDLTFRHWIAISMKNGFVRGASLYPAHYALLYLTKGEPAHFHRPRMDPKTCRKCGALIKDYGGYREIVESKGVNLSDVWDDLSPVRHRANKHRRANELPLELTNRVVSIAGVESGLLVDPFVGSGTSVVSALDHGLRFVANDIEVSNLDICMQRLGLVSGPKSAQRQRRPAALR